ncbi:hypothetical protein T11_12786 [Trichinella zimbabwensis]|uniref:Uncharacterized protein n=1 Tax=Trichinella zimbabwensis TaxID=268475 RepID=A0A0V1HHZ5_9BILA|nr:hypothetical protein T11_12786 [Trichinella zimbabwensis]
MISIVSQWSISTARACIWMPRSEIPVREINGEFSRKGLFHRSPPLVLWRLFDFNMCPDNWGYCVSSFQQCQWLAWQHGTQNVTNSRED